VQRQRPSLPRLNAPLILPPSPSRPRLFKKYPVTVPGPDSLKHTVLETHLSMEYFYPKRHAGTPARKGLTGTALKDTLSLPPASIQLNFGPFVYQLT
jgi:hypothetical protein